MRTSPQGASQPSSCPYPGCQRKRGAGSSLPRQTLLLTARLHFQEGNKRGHLILHSLQANELCELPLDLGERTRSNLRSWLHLLEPFSRRTKRPPELRHDYAKPGEEVFNRTKAGWHEYRPALTGAPTPPFRQQRPLPSLRRPPLRRPSVQF